MPVGSRFDRQNWTVKSITSGAVASVVLSLTSPDGDMCYPGEVNATVSYALRRTAQAENSSELLVVGRALRSRSLTKVAELATHAGQVGGVRQPDEVEVRRFALDGFEKRARRRIEQVGDPRQ